MESELERLRKKVENFPSASTFTRLAELSRDAGDAAGAEEWCRKCLRAFPRHGMAYVILGDLQATRGHTDEALKTLASGIEKDPRLAQAHRAAAEILARAGRTAEAVIELKKALVIKDDEQVRTRLRELGGGASPAAPAPAASSRPASPLAGAMPAPPRPAAAAATPFAQPVTTPFARPAAPAQARALDHLAAEAGIRGVAVADASGRVISTKGLTAGQDEALAALGAEVGRGAAMALGTIGGGALATWAIASPGGQVLAFTRSGSVTVLVLAEPTVRPAMIELRARQVLAELGAA
ncbi:MAG: hypothetical protein RLZZ127_409 [Planctomycetota bacterium]